MLNKLGQFSVMVACVLFAYTLILSMQLKHAEQDIEKLTVVNQQIVAINKTSTEALAVISNKMEKGNEIIKLLTEQQRIIKEQTVSFNNKLNRLAENDKEIKIWINQHIPSSVNGLLEQSTGGKD